MTATNGDNVRDKPQRLKSNGLDATAILPPPVSAPQNKGPTTTQDTPVTDGIAPGTTQSSCPTIDTTNDPWSVAHKIPVKRDPPLFIYPRAVVEWRNNGEQDPGMPVGCWTKDEYQKRCDFIASEMGAAVKNSSDPALKHAARCASIKYDHGMVGTSPQTAKPYMIVYCHNKHIEGLEKLFRKRNVNRLIDDRNTTPQSLLARLFGLRNSGCKVPEPPFGLIYFSEAPMTKTALEGSVETNSTHIATWCGEPVYSPHRAATLGLMVQVGDLLGVTTVAHIFGSSSSHDKDVDDMLDDGAGSSDLEDDDEYDTGAMWIDPGIQSMDQYEEEGIRNKGPETFGVSSGDPDTVCLWKQIPPPQQLSANEPFLDWSLTMPVSYPLHPRRNLYHPTGNDTHLIALENLADAPRYHCVPVHVLSAFQGVLSGELLERTARIQSGPGEALSRVWTVLLTPGTGRMNGRSKTSFPHVANSALDIMNGDSGSLIIDQETKQIYGHLVGIGSYKMGYVIPMMDIFAQIGTCFDADVRIFTESSQLPSASTRQEEALRPNPDLLPRMKDTTVSDNLMQAMVETDQEWGVREFIPDQVIRSIINESAVQDQLQQGWPSQLSDEQQQTYLSEIFGPQTPRLKIFAILVLLEKVSTLADFIAAGISDHDLPLTVLDRSGTSLRTMKTVSQPATELKFTQPWAVFYLKSFMRVQQAFLSPVFRMSTTPGIVKHYVLSDEQILPFVKISTNDIVRVSKGRSNHSQDVSLVKIHPAQHDFPTHVSKPHTGRKSHANLMLSIQNNLFFIKKLVSGSSEDLADQPQNDHLILPLVSFSHRSRYNVILPWVEANVATYWNEINPDPVFSKTVVWVLEQCVGLASVLSLLHNRQDYSAYTLETDEEENSNPDDGRIVPAKILWLPDRELSTSDVPLGKLSVSNYGLHKRFTKPGPGAGVSPQASHQPQNQVKIDIWSLGCVYLEFITWLLGGSAHLLWFANRRIDDDPYAPDPKRFYKIERRQGLTVITLKPVVNEVSVAHFPSCDNTVLNQATDDPGVTSTSIRIQIRS